MNFCLYFCNRIEWSMWEKKWILFLKGVKKRVLFAPAIGIWNIIVERVRLVSGSAAAAPCAARGCGAPKAPAGRGHSPARSKEAEGLLRSLRMATRDYINSMVSCVQEWLFVRSGMFLNSRFQVPSLVAKTWGQVLEHWISVLWFRTCLLFISNHLIRLK